MQIFENVRLQLVDLPPISPEYTDSWVPQVIRNADAILWLVDLSDDDLLDRLDETRTFLADGHVELDEMKVLIICTKQDSPGSAERASIVQEAVQNQFPLTTISAAAASSEDIEQFKRVV